MGQQINTSGTTGSWANPGNELITDGFNLATMSVPGPCGVNCTNSNQIYGFHNGVVNVVFADGSVHTMTEFTNVAIVIALLTRNGGEEVSALNYD